MADAPKGPTTWLRTGPRVTEARPIDGPPVAAHPDLFGSPQADPQPGSALHFGEACPLFICGEARRRQYARAKTTRWADGRPSMRQRPASGSPSNGLTRIVGPVSSLTSRSHDT